MRFEVPQFIEVEDKIFGPFTWRQFIYISGGIGVLVICYLTLPFLFFIIIGLPVAALSGFLAFQKINNRPFSVFLEAMFGYFSGIRLYLWKKDKTQTITADQGGTSVAVTPPQASPPTSSDSLSSLSQKLALEAMLPDETDADKTKDTINI